MKSPEGKNTKDYREDSIGEKTRFITRMLSNCLVEDKVRDTNTVCKNVFGFVLYMECSYIYFIFFLGSFLFYGASYLGLL